MTGIPKKQKTPFTLKEKRVLTLREERIDPKYLTDGKPPKVEAEHKRTGKYPTHEARHYQLRIADCGLRIDNDVKIQLNHGDPADDAERLVVITEDLLAPVRNPENLIPDGVNNAA